MVGNFTNKIFISMKKNHKKIISSPGHEFENNVAESFNEIYQFIEVLGDEHRRLVNTNSILLHSVKAMKNILTSQSLMTGDEFENAYNQALSQTKNLKVSQSIVQHVDNEKLYHNFIIENVPPAHS